MNETSMEDKLDELKQLIDSLATDSPLRKELEKVMEGSIAKKLEVTADEQSALTDETPGESRQEDEAQQMDKHEEDQMGGQENDGSEEQENFFDRLKDNIENVMEDDEFITAAAGFVLGAMVVGVGATLVAAMKK